MPELNMEIFDEDTKLHSIDKDEERQNQEAKITETLLKEFSHSNKFTIDEAIDVISNEHSKDTIIEKLDSLVKDDVLIKHNDKYQINHNSDIISMLQV